VERSAAPDAAKALRRDRSDVLEAVDHHLGLHPSGEVRLAVHRLAMYAWGASDAVRPDAMADAFLALRLLLQGADAGRSAVRALDVPALAGCRSVVLLLDEPERNKPDALPSAA